MLNLYRQGDVMLEKAVIPQRAEKIDCDLVVLVHGMSTGHDHAFEKNVKEFRNGQDRFVDVVAPESLTHQEHTHLEIEPDSYEVIRQCEFWGETIGEVID